MLYLNKKEIIREKLLVDKNIFLKRVGSVLKEERIGKRISRTSLSKMVDFTENYIGYIEQGRYNISLLKFILIANELDLNPNYIINKSLDDVLEMKITNWEEKDISKEIIMYLKNTL